MSTNINLTWDFDDERELLLALAGNDIVAKTIEAAITEICESKRKSFTRFVQYARLSASDTVAEIGGGFGAVSHYMSTLVRHVFCVDISQTYQAIAKRVATRPNVTFQLTSPGDLSCLRDKGINKICSEACFIHLNLFDIYNYAQQVFDILPKAGLFVFDIANANNPNIWQDRVWKSHYGDYLVDRNCVWQKQVWHDPNTICAMLSHIGFFVESVHAPDWAYSYLVARKR